MIICTWNRAALLDTTLRSLNAQQSCGSIEIEVIVVDNNSSDNTKEVVARVRRDWRLGSLHYCFEPRQGKQFALNTGLGVSKMNVLAFTDDDVVLSPLWLASIAQVFENEALDLAGGRTLLVWPAAGKPSWFDPGMSAILGGVDLGESRLFPPPSGYAPSGANLVARRKLFDEVGMYSEAHFRHMDYEFGMRCAHLEAQISYEPSLVVYAPVAPGCLSKRYFRRWSFKAGIARDEGEARSGPHFLSAPRWVFRQTFEDFIFLLLGGFLSDDGVSFGRELRMWRGIGVIASRLHERLRPGQHAKWVEKYSQKKRDLY